ncbi:hypothetical protein FT663_02749 [Candidozyma haemuli var. vulneris]|nr:hypothetical protein FT662_02838 [[Candida] haemuloni var. vulneris]KAF3991342.1 hypothetical protein FT663_02749 [[Candida] haemuloni var. vulneris]
MTVSLNYNSGEIVSSPSVIVSGRTTAHVQSGLVQFVNNANKVFPPQFFEVNNGQFKAFVHVSPGEENNFEIHILDRAHLDGSGFPVNHQNVVDSGKLTLFFNPLPQNKPVHLCIILGRDSNGTYDMPKYKTNQGQYANLDTGIQRLKVAARMMQAFTQDEFHRLGLSNRSFQFVEETVSHQGIFGYNVESPTPHQEVKVHVLRSPKTVSELRNRDIAQQVSDAKDKGWLFNHAIDLIRNSPDLIGPYKQNNTAIQCAVLYMDSTWNKKFVTTHAALGGGTGDVKLAIFGSHGLHSYPFTFPQISTTLTDGTKLSINEVANDANQCGTTWECHNICLGAFMHEIGHSFGSPHQTDGVMLRDYIWWNRCFVTREVRCIRDGSNGRIINPDGSWPRECHWNIRDLIRYFYHDSFTIPIDDSDPSFPKSYNTTMKPDNSYQNGEVPLSYPVGEGKVSVKSDAGIFMVELVDQDLARFHTTYYPKSYGGPGLQHEINLDYNQCLRDIRNQKGDASANFSVRVLSVAGDLWIPDFKKHCHSANTIKSDFGLGRGNITGIKSALLGSEKGEMKYIGFDAKGIYKVRVYHGGALDGFTIFYNSTSGQEDKPPVPAKSSGGLNRFMNKLNISDQRQSGSGGGEVTLGNKKSHYTDFNLQQGETVERFSFRNGQWLDAMRIHTNQGRASPMLGNASGGHLSSLSTPGPEYQIVGMYGYTSRWMDGLGIIYARLS